MIIETIVRMCNLVSVQSVVPGDHTRSAVVALFQQGDGGRRLLGGGQHQDYSVGEEPTSNRKKK